jgi:hypothetical protein
LKVAGTVGISDGIDREITLGAGEERRQAYAE